MDLVDWQSTVVDPFERVKVNIIDFLPRLFFVILILIVGWMIASVLQKVITRFLKLARLDTVSEKIGIANILTKGDINYTLSEIVGVLVYWLMMLVVALAAVNVLELSQAASLLQHVILYIPRVIASVFILVLGVFFASVIGNTVRTAAANTGLSQARSLGQFTQVLIVVFTIIEALKQLHIDTSIIEMLVMAIFAALALGVGLAIGLGCKDIAQRHVQQLIDSFKPRK